MPRDFSRPLKPLVGRLDKSIDFAVGPLGFQVHGPFLERWLGFFALFVAFFSESLPWILARVLAFSLRVLYLQGIYRTRK